MSSPIVVKGEPRIVCTRCLAEVKIHRCEPCQFEDSYLLWLECHATHLLVELDGAMFTRLRHQPERDLTLQDLTDISDHGPA